MALSSPSGNNFLGPAHAASATPASQRRERFTPKGSASQAPENKGARARHGPTTGEPKLRPRARSCFADFPGLPFPLAPEAPHLGDRWRMGTARLDSLVEGLSVLERATAAVTNRARARPSPEAARGFSRMTAGENTVLCRVSPPMKSRKRTGRLDADSGRPTRRFLREGLTPARALQCKSAPPSAAAGGPFGLPALQPRALDRLTRSEMYSLTEPHCTPVHRRPTGAFATATKIGTRVSAFPLHPGSRSGLRRGPHARLLAGCLHPPAGCYRRAHNIVHFRCRCTRQVCCYTLLTRCRLPWPRSCCLSAPASFGLPMPLALRVLKHPFGESHIANTAYQSGPVGACR